jgi:hypothetical protein
LAEQLEAQDPPMQMPGAHDLEAPGRQVPAPSQVLAANSVALLQRPSAHWVFTG